MSDVIGIFSGLDAPVAIVAHDAGAANHLAAWLHAYSISDSGCLPVMYGCLDGPAKAIFSQKCPWLEIVDMSALFPTCRTLVSGTGWASSLEHEARKLALASNARCIAVIDHWVNYSERFVRNNTEALPNEVWVSDEYAEAIASKEFPEAEIVQLSNLYLQDLVRELRQYEPGACSSIDNHILYVLEPIRQAWGCDDLPGEFQALSFFADNVEVLGLKGNVEIRLRPHPSDASGKYDAWIQENNALRVELDPCPNLSQSIAWADVVVGCHTYAMVVAQAAGKRVVSSIPSWGPSCVLPQSGIERMAVISAES